MTQTEIKDIDLSTKEGKLLMMALASLTVSPSIRINGEARIGTGMTPDEVLREIEKVAIEIYPEYAQPSAQPLAEWKDKIAAIELGYKASNEPHRISDTDGLLGEIVSIVEQNVVAPLQAQLKPSTATPEAISLLKEYEQWEADLINDNAMWWPYAEKDAISGKTYEKMLDLQAKRNEILSQPSTATPVEGEPEDWISVETQLPELGELVLVHNTEGAILTGRLMNNGWVANFRDGENFMNELTATHWMPLPTPPITEPKNNGGIK